LLVGISGEIKSQRPRRHEISNDIETKQADAKQTYITSVDNDYEYA